MYTRSELENILYFYSTAPRENLQARMIFRKTVWEYCALVWKNEKNVKSRVSLEEYITERDFGAFVTRLILFHIQISTDEELGIAP